MRDNSPWLSRCLALWRFLLPPVYMAMIFFLSEFPGRHGIEPSNWLGPVMLNLLHVPLYAGLAWLCKFAADSLPAGKLAINLAIFAVCLLYAASDEWHQMYVIGRDASIVDLVLDGTGIWLGIWLFDRYGVPAKQSAG